jgi:hypothetical protein
MPRLLGRTVVSYSAPLSLTNVLDPAGRVTAAGRNGGGGGSPIVQRRAVFDSAHLVASETNALAGGTGCTGITGTSTCRRTRTPACPDGGAHIQTFSSDGPSPQGVGNKYVIGLWRRDFVAGRGASDEHTP